jgi:hypothetical protein
MVEMTGIQTIILQKARAITGFMSCRECRSLDQGDLHQPLPTRVRYSDFC